MLRPYISSSSISSWSLCQLKWFFSYMLDKRDEPNKKALMGNIVHTVAETIGSIKIETQKGIKSGEINTEEISGFKWDITSFLSPSIISKEEEEKINNGRINKQIYISDCKVKAGDVRLGRDLINSLVEKSWSYYTDKYKTIDWTKSDRRDVYNWTWMLLEGLEIRKLNIIGVEVPFDVPIEHPDCKLDDGSYIRCKGFIDLLHESHPGIYEVVDFKTGQRRNFNNGEEKTLEDLSKDLQLCLYTYIVRKLYPEAKHVLTSIFYIRDGGMFTPEFADDSDEYIFKTIHEHIKELRTCEQPTVLSETRDDFRCRYLCGASKTFDYSKDKCNCQFIKEKIREQGIEETIKQYKDFQV